MVKNEFLWGTAFLSQLIKPFFLLKFHFWIIKRLMVKNEFLWERLLNFYIVAAVFFNGIWYTINDFWL